MNPRSKDKYTLVADVGGTNTRVALADGKTLLPQSIQKYQNSGFPGLETVLRQYIEDENAVECARACVAVAGPVRAGIGELTNLDWTIDKDLMARATGATKVAILNDMQAQGNALGHIDPDSISAVIDSRGDRPDAAKLVIGIGTGFNAATVYETEIGRLVPPSECGHANLPIRTEAELRLCQFVETAHGFPAIEDVLSGRGLERVYRWLGHEVGDEHELGAAAIMQAVAEETDPRAVDTVRQFVHILGTVAGNLSLIQLPLGGVYLAGGVARAMSPYLKDYGFLDAFHDKGRFAGFMKNFSVSVIEDDFAALTGCACHIATLP